MLELIGLIAGGASRLFQHWLDLRDKQNERQHELAMFDKQATLAAASAAHESELRRMDAESAATQADFSALTAAIEAQAKEAAAAGGWVATLSASVRPVIMYWLLAIYTAAKVSALVMAHTYGASFASVLQNAYTDFDAAILSSALSYWLADRSLLRWRGARA